MPRRTSDSISPSQDFKNRMARARSELPKGIGQNAVIEYVVELAPELNKLTNFSRWESAWNGRAADVEITQLVELAAAHFKIIQKKAVDRLKRQKLNKL